MSGTIALIVAAGRGHRVGGEIPKQYRKLGNHSVLYRTLSTFCMHPEIDAVRVVIHADDRVLYDVAVGGLELLDPVFGGPTRQESVRLGLASLRPLQPDTVLIHDAARPFVDPSIISRVIQALGQSAGAIPVVAVSDTLKKCENGQVLTTVDRATLWRAQTPQGFRFREIMDAHDEMADRNLTDDAAVAETAGLSVAMVDGNEKNTKITTSEDLKICTSHAPEVEFRTGYGFDVHRFTDGNHVMLCGVRVPHHLSLDGHSDADVGLHALTDAVLGAIGGGDIGHHFPPSDNRWRGATSDQFLAHAASLLAARAGLIVNVDVTLICESPKIGPYRTEMVRRLAEILEIDPQRVNVKATTTERLGFTGRGEGIAAQAVATVKLGSLR